MITITAMAGLASVQDFGRRGYGAAGVARGGAMDPLSMAQANALVGNPPGSAVLEWALGGGSLEFATDAIVAIAGAEVEAQRGGNVFPMVAAASMRAGERLTIQRFVRGRFAYVAVRGGIEVPLVLGSRSTYLSAGFGGHEGRRLRAGDKLAIGRQVYAVARPTGFFATVGSSSRIRVVEGPDSAMFSEDFRKTFWDATFTVSPASDRIGYRLVRAGAEPMDTGSMTSEPVCPGAIQVPPSSEPIVLMAEGPTVGGYPKIGVVISADLPVLAQKQPGEIVEFERIPLAEAQRLARAEAVAGGGDPA